MKYQCSQNTDLDDLIGHDELDGFHSGPLYTAMKGDEPLELIGSATMSPAVQAKLESFSHGFMCPETGELIEAPIHFELVFH